MSGGALTNRRWALAAVAAIVAASWIAVYLVLPGIVQRHPAEVLGALGFTGPRSSYDTFIRMWPRFHLMALGIVLLLGLALWLSTQVWVQRWIDRRVGSAIPVNPDSEMGGRRTIVVGLVITILVGVQFASDITSLEVWPFSPHAMYSTIQGPTLAKTRIVVTTATGEVLIRDTSWLAPFDPMRLDVALDRLRRRADGGAAAGAAAQFALERYNINRTRRQDTLPPADGVKVYRATWILDPQGRNRDHPDSLELVYAWSLRK
jgi:hypothetical protein